MDTNEYIDALIKSARCEIQTREYCNTHICEECQFNDESWFGNNNDLLCDMANALEDCQKKNDNLNQIYLNQLRDIKDMLDKLVHKVKI